MRVRTPTKSHVVLCISVPKPCCRLCGNVSAVGIKSSFVNIFCKWGTFTMQLNCNWSLEPGTKWIIRWTISDRTIKTLLPHSKLASWCTTGSCQIPIAAPCFSEGETHLKVNTLACFQHLYLQCTDTVEKLRFLTHRCIPGPWRMSY